MTATMVRRGASLVRSSATHVAFAFLAMGGWAAFANRQHGLTALLMAGAVQGALSAGITLVLKTAVERMARHLAGLTALWLPPLVAALTSATLLSTIHRLAGTPELLATIALPLSVATGYATIYNAFLWAARRAER